MKLIIGTKNKAKLSQIKGALTGLDLEVMGLPDIELPEVEENGKTAQENARKKAVAYSQALGEKIFSMDNALYINGLSEDKQPGINVRRIEGRTDRPSDEELLNYYTDLISQLGDNVGGHWEFAVCIADPDGKTKETTIISKRDFIAKQSGKIIEGYPLESVQVDPESKKYISEMTREEQDKFWQKMIGRPLRKFIEEALNI